MKKNGLAVIILAAGKGKRMKSQTSKVLHPVCGRPMIGYVLDLAKALRPEKTIVVLGHKHDEVRKVLPAWVNIVIQKQLKGTADAVRLALSRLNNFRGTVLILYGDVPLLTAASLKKLLKRHSGNAAAATLLTAGVSKPFGYGRILRDGYSCISGIVEEKDADEYQKETREINTGIICFDKALLAAALKRVRPDNRKKEYYLTDAIAIFYKAGQLISGVSLEDSNEALGINSRQDLAKANLIMRNRINAEVMARAVTIIDPDVTYINYGTQIGHDSVIYPFTVIERDVKIGKSCVIGPFAHLREGTRLGNGVTAGNFLEVVRSTIGSKTLLKHFSYIGDSKVGRQVNIGAGTVTANFDGKNKNLTVIGDSAFIGSDTVLVAPAKIGKAAKTGAGSVVVRNTVVAAGSVVAGVPAKPLKRK
ncbi:MAG: NTP transferase domain-containing protein [Candidatus Omnitrophota bacterium]